jgi:3',5'-cyclic AMP phosphodiesterase CpdA
MSEQAKINRRDVLRAGAATTILGATGLSTHAVAEQPSHKARRRSLRFAHLTDAHVQQARGGGDGLAACLRHAQSHADKPELIVFGGDNVMNVDGRDGAKTAKEQLAVFNSAVRDACDLPYRCAVGNHDILRLDPKDGKKWAVDAFEIPAPYYSFDQAGWRFVMLDSTSPEGGGYKGRLDEEQFEWLAGVLKETPNATPICIVSHIPIMGVCCYFDGENEKSGDWRVPGAWMHIDARRLKDLFKQHTNVKLCISGHMHLADTAEYLGVKYACNGAVSGAWWGGNYHEFAPGYALVDLYEDGGSEVEYVTYGWKTRD